MKKKKLWFGWIREDRFKLVIVTTLFCLSSFAQVTDADLVIESCYQQFLLDGEDKNVLAGSSFKLNFTTGTSNYGVLQIEYFDHQNERIPHWYDGLTGDGFYLNWVNVTHADGSIESFNGVRTWNGEHYNDGVFSIPPETKTITIRLASLFDGDNTYRITETTTLHAKETHEAFELVNAGDECFTFDDFRPDVLPNLDGFCGNLTAKIQSDPDAIEPNYDWSIDLGVSNNISDRKDCATACENVIASASLSDPVPCGCEIVKMEVTLEPCAIPGKELCPEITMMMGAEVCCKCDVREFDNSQN